MNQPDVINAVVVASFECPKCNLVMVREHLEAPLKTYTTYHCHNSDCERNQIRYYAPDIYMNRVDAVERW